MHRDALTHLDLYCTSCRTFEGRVTQHKLILLPQETQAEYVITGRLECPHCHKRYPITDGVPCLIQGVPGNEEQTAQFIDSHYGTENVGNWRKMNSARGNGLCLDVGCSVGRYTFECARKGFAVGIDANLEHLRLAAGFQRAGKINYTRKTRALSHEGVESRFAPSKNALFLLADIHDPPFKMETFDFIGALNVIDSVKRPLTALGQMDAMLKQNGRLFLSSPYVWNADISEEWLETEDIEPHSFLKMVLTGKRVPECGFNYRITMENTGIPWRLRKQDALQFSYFVDAIVAEKV